MSVSIFQEATISNQQAASYVSLNDFWAALKTSPNHNMTECGAARSPFVGYSNLPYSKANFMSLADQYIGTGSMIHKSDEIMPLTAEISHKLLHVRGALCDGFRFVTNVKASRITSFLLPVEKLLFDILKNLVTFTASNHCMYGGKRYN